MSPASVCKGGNGDPEGISKLFAITEDVAEQTIKPSVSFSVDLALNVL